VITGETGAGKSLLLDALELLLGGRADRGLIRQGAERAEVQALFRVGATSPVAVRLAQRALIDPGPSADVDVVVRRLVQASGRGRATVNGALVTIRELRALTSELIDITGQHDHADLLRAEHHLSLLDAHAGLESEKRQMLEAWSVLETSRAARDALLHRDVDQSAREDYLRFQLAALTELDLHDGEMESLELERRRLSHAETLLEGALLAETHLMRRPSNALELLAESVRCLEALATHDPDLGDAARRLEAARIEIDDVALDLARYGHRVEADPRRLRAVEDRLDAIHRLARRHGVECQGLVEQRVLLLEELESFEDVETKLHEAERQYELAGEEAQGCAMRLRERRRTTALALGAAVVTELQGLGMDEARIEVRVTARERLGPDGDDRVEIFVETNAGEGLHALRRVASGGELSRLTLAIEGATRGIASRHTAVYDEIDSGVSGAIAESIGRKLREASTGGQALVITHMPQIAALGSHHLTVNKTQVSGRTCTSVSAVTGRDRSCEIARMLGGSRRSRRVADHADELLRRGRRAA